MYIPDAHFCPRVAACTHFVHCVRHKDQHFQHKLDTKETLVACRLARVCSPKHNEPLIFHGWLIEGWSSRVCYWLRLVYKLAAHVRTSQGGGVNKLAAHVRTSQGGGVV